MWWTLTIVFFLVSCFSGWYGFRILEQEKKFPYGILVFPPISLGFLITALFHTLRRMKFGESIFNMHPRLITDQLRGLIETSVKLPDTSFKLKLICIERISKKNYRGRNEPTVSRTLWKREIGKVKQLPDVEAGYSLIPVRFQIPDKLPDSGYWKGGHSAVWQLEISAELPGIDYRETFEIPIFRRDPEPPPEKNRDTPPGNPEDDQPELLPES